MQVVKVQLYILQLKGLIYNKFNILMSKESVHNYEKNGFD